MRIFYYLFCIFVFLNLTNAAEDPTLYEYYTSGGIHSSLETNSDQFKLNGKQLVIYSGSFHYFRVPPQRWANILAKFKAAGLNTVQFYLPWNLHEDIPGKFDFTSEALNLAKFLEEIKKADMFAIVRPGPFISAEWDLGGFPTWLLHDPHMEVRSAYKPFLDRVKLFFDEAFKIVNRFQFSQNGGPVIMLQIENEYSYQIPRKTDSKQYLKFLYDTVVASGFKEQLFVSDPDWNSQQYLIKGIFPNNSVLQTMNLNKDSVQHLTALRQSQPNKPLFISEFWPGWFDAWYDKQHHRMTVEFFESEVSEILFKMNASINFYMFIGGTNFAFTSGGRVITSYDYDAPLSEAGNFTAKYHKTRELYQKLVSTGRLPKTRLPDVPQIDLALNYGKHEIQELLSYEILLEHAIKLTNVPRPVPMESLNIGENYGQRFGYVVYRVEAKEAREYEITGRIHDRAYFLVDNKQVQILWDQSKNFTHTFTQALEPKVNKYDLMAEVLGRDAGGDNMSINRKGIMEGEIKLNGKAVNNLTIYSMDFNQTYVNLLNGLSSGWVKYDHAKQIEYERPSLYRFKLNLNGSEHRDTYVSLPGWNKGNVFVNGFNLGRYWTVGPQRTLYVPGVLFKSGENVIDVFEINKPGQALEFLDHPVLE